MRKKEGGAPRGDEIKRVWLGCLVCLSGSLVCLSASLVCLFVYLARLRSVMGPVTAHVPCGPRHRVISAVHAVCEQSRGLSPG